MRKKSTLDPNYVTGIGCGFDASHHLELIATKFIHLSKKEKLWIHDYLMTLGHGDSVAAVVVVGGRLIRGSQEGCGTLIGRVFYEGGEVLDCIQ